MPLRSFFRRLKNLRWSRIVLWCMLVFGFNHYVMWKWQDDNWKMTLGSDGQGYYAYLPATYIYHDYQFTFLDTLWQKYPVLGLSVHCGFCNQFNDKGVDKYFAGESVAQTPFFLVAHWCSGDYAHPKDGYSYYYMASVGLSALFYLMLGLLCIRKLLLRFKVKDLHVAIVLVCIFSGTNLFYYGLWDAAMTHIYSFGFISCFLLLAHLQFEKFSAARMLLLGFVFGMIVLIRPVNAVAITALPFLAGDWTILKNFFREAVRRWIVSLGAVLTCAAVIFIQLLYYHLECGKWMVYAYSKEGFDFLHPNFFNCLFSYSNGFYVYAPVLFIFTLGVFTLLPKNKFRFFGFFLYFISTVWVISSWWAWTYGGAFGMRPMVEHIALFAVCGGLLLNYLSTKKFLLPAVSILLLLPLVLLIQLQIWQIRYGIIANDKMTKEKYWRVFLETRDQFLYINSDVFPSPLPQGAKLVYQKKFDFEKSEGLDTRSFTTEKAFSGKTSVCLREGNNHQPGIHFRIGDIVPDSILQRQQLWLSVESKWSMEDLGSDARLVATYSRDGHMYTYQDFFVIHEVDKKNTWTNVIWNTRIPPVMQPQDIITVNPRRDNWYPVYIDDFTVKIYSE